DPFAAPARGGRGGARRARNAQYVGKAYTRAVMRAVLLATVLVAVTYGGARASAGRGSPPRRATARDERAGVDLGFSGRGAGGIRQHARHRRGVRSGA